MFPGCDKEHASLKSSLDIHYRRVQYVCVCVFRITILMGFSSAPDKPAGFCSCGETFIDPLNAAQHCQTTGHARIQIDGLNGLPLKEPLPEGWCERYIPEETADVRMEDLEHTSYTPGPWDTGFDNLRKASPSERQAYARRIKSIYYPIETPAIPQTHSPACRQEGISIPSASTSSWSPPSTSPLSHWQPDPTAATLPSHSGYGSRSPIPSSPSEHNFIAAEFNHGSDPDSPPPSPYSQPDYDLPSPSMNNDDDSSEAFISPRAACSWWGAPK